MSDPKRYSICASEGNNGHITFPDLHITERLLGHWVTYSDYAALQAEYERLRKAGDALIRICEIHESNKDEYVIRWNAWQNAKEGRNAK